MWKKSVISVFSVFVFISTYFNANVNGFSLISSKVIKLYSNATHTVTLKTSEIPSSTSLVLVSAHCFNSNVSLSYSPKMTQLMTIKGQNLGLIMAVDDDGHDDHNDDDRSYGVKYNKIWIFNNNSLAIDVLLVINALQVNDPIPGACNSEFPMEYSPFLELSSDGILDRLQFQYSNIGFPKGFTPLSCESSQYLIKYEIYAYYMREDDYSQKEYFRSLKLMSDISTIKKYATKIESVSTSPHTRAFFYSYPGRGVVYNVIARAQNYESAYVPMANLRCDYSLNGCDSWFVIISIIIYSIFGLIVCLRGHLWFNLQMAFFGFIVASVPTIILMSKYTSFGSDERDVSTIVAGVIGSIIWVSVWKMIHIPLLSISLSGFVLGFLTISTILFTEIGNFSLFQSDTNYWIIMSCGMIVIPIVLLPYGVLLSITSSSIVGAYSAIITIDRFIGSSLTYIILNVIKRAVFDTFKAQNNVPFQTKDIVLSIMWVLLSITGISLQLYCSRDRSPFPPPSSCSHPHLQRSHRSIHDNSSGEEYQNSRHHRHRYQRQRFSPLPYQYSQIPNSSGERQPLLYAQPSAPNYNDITIHAPRES